jgi:glycosyltransferase involved in cell wall biosynthesis
MKILYIGNNVSTISSGCDRLNQRNLSLINNITNGNFDIIEFSGKKSIFDILFLHIGGISYELINKVMCHLEKHQYDFIFFSSSLHGQLIKKLKKKKPEVKIICNFHNIEKMYASEFLKVSGLSHLYFYFAALYNERKAVRYMDYSLVLNNRDAELLSFEYHRTPNLVLPIAYEDNYNENKRLVSPKNNETLYLFVGVSFFANIEAIKWFVINVLPNIPGKLLIIGKGMDKYQKEFASERIKTIGFVDDLSEYYYNATFVIAPIMSGGGMKTKIVEALMYGKTIIGSKESFEGFIFDTEAMYICNSAVEYIETINKLVFLNKTYPYNNASRNLFKQYYSINAIANRFNNALNTWINSD